MRIRANVNNIMFISPAACLSKTNHGSKVDVTILFMSQAYTQSAWAELRAKFILPIGISTNHISMKCIQYCMCGLARACVV